MHFISSFFLIQVSFLFKFLSYSFYKFISSENDLKSNSAWSQRHNLYQTVITKVWNNKPFVKSTLLRYKLHNTISIQIDLLETTYINTCSIIVTNTRLISSSSILSRLHAVSSRLLQILWHSNGLEPKVHFFLLESKSGLSPIACSWWSPTSSTHHVRFGVNLDRNHFWEKRFRWHNPSLGRRDRDGGEQTTNLDKTESPSKVFMSGVSTQKWPSN